SRLAQRDFELYRFYFTERAHKIVDIVRECAKETGCTPAQLALAWQLTKPEVSSIIIGVRSLAQLDDNLGATAVTIPPDVLARLDKESAPPPEYPGAMIDFVQAWLGNR